jgi:acetyl esterase/lipase
MTDDRPTVQIPAREIPIPRSVSAEAQAILAMPPMESPPYPEVDDFEGWRKLIAETDAMVATIMADRVASAPVEVTDLDVDGVRVHEIVPHECTADDRRTFLDIHGGGFTSGGGIACRAMGTGAATRVGARVWAVDYRMPPDHRYPAALDDCVTVYTALLRDHVPAEIIVGGASAGGNLAAALMLRAKAADLPLPAALVLMTPGVDLTEASDSIHTNLGLDQLLTARGTNAFALYAGGARLDDPYLSPVFGDLTGFPPTILTTGTRDLLLSDTVRMHRALRMAGVDAELHVTEAGGHGGFFGMAPEDREIEREIRVFVDRHWGR